MTIDNEPWNDESNDEPTPKVLSALGTGAILLAFIWVPIIYVVVGFATAVGFLGLFLTTAVVCMIGSAVEKAVEEAE